MKSRYMTKIKGKKYYLVAREYNMAFAEAHAKSCELQCAGSFALYEQEGNEWCLCAISSKKAQLIGL